MTDHVEGRLTGVPDGSLDVELFWQGWLPDGAPSGVVLLSHGIGEHSGRYRHVVDELVVDGWAVYGLDHRGHGRSGGTRAHARRYQDLVSDLETFRALVAARHPGLPVFLLGHSMGGQIALAHAVAHQRELAGLVLSAPALANDIVPARLVPALQVIARVLPTIRLVGIDVTRISRDPDVVRDYQDDPLVHHGNPTLALGAAVYAQMEVLTARSGELRLPVLVQHGTEDELTDPTGTRRFEAACGAPDTTVRWYEGLWHEIYNEPDRALPLGDLRTWLGEHRASASAST